MTIKSAPALMVLSMLLVSGCMNIRDIGRFNDQFRIDSGTIPLAVKPTEEGLFIREDAGISVKFRAKSFLSVVDELAYKLGFNYTVLSDLTRFKVNIYNYVEPPANLQLLPGDDPADFSPFKQRQFSDETALLDELKDQINQQIQSRHSDKTVFFDYRWVSDGPEFYLARRDNDVEQVVCTLQPMRIDDCSKMTFKKVFLKNITSDEAAKSISDLFANEVELRRVKEQIPIMPAAGMQGSPYGGGFFPPMQNFGGQQPADTNKASLLQYRPQNAVLIRSQDPAIYERVAAIIPSLDANFQQVLVETQVYEYDDTIGRKIGVALDYSQGSITNRAGENVQKFGIKTQFGTDFADKLPMFFGNLSSIEKKATLLSQLALYDQDGLVRILAEPTLVLKSGEEAEVKLETRRYFLTSGVNVAGDLKDLPTGIDFKVTPTVLGDDKILLNLYIRQSEFINSSDPNVAASTNHNEIHSSVIAKDGELISIGGIHKKKDSKISSGIPGIRNIPGVGALFGSDAQSTEVLRVEFLIRPTVNRSKEVLAGRLKSISDVNCRITDWMGKKDPRCKPANTILAPATTTGSGIDGNNMPVVQ